WLYQPGRLYFSGRGHGVDCADWHVGFEGSVPAISQVAMAIARDAQPLHERESLEQAAGAIRAGESDPRRTGRDARRSASFETRNYRERGDGERRNGGAASASFESAGPATEHRRLRHRLF